MTLGRQLASAISVIFFAALIGVQVIHLRSAQSHLQRQLESLAQDAATSIGLSLGTTLRAADAALAQTVISPAFDRGHYERIEYVSAAGERLVSKYLPPSEGGYPAWFVDVFPLHSPTAESLVSSGWQQLGKVRVTVHPRFAYEQLWATARDTLLYLLLIYAAAMLALRLFLRSVLRPLKAVERAAQAIAARNFVTLEIQPATRELARVIEAMNSMSRKVNEAIETETRRAERLQDAVYHDEVTGLLNARGFAARFESVYEGEGEPFSGVFALFEVADLGAINRALGAARCDELLRHLNRPLEQAAAASGGFAGRSSGALTVLAMPGLGVDAASELLGALRARALLALREFGLDRHERIYCGGAAVLGGPATLHGLARVAEEALLRARESSDGVVVLHAQPHGAVARGDATLTVVRDALAARRVQLVGQAVHGVRDQRRMHTEILARLLDDSGRLIAAAEFMPIVAAHGLGEQLDRAVIERVVQIARERGGEEAISVNVSMRSAEQPGFAQWLDQLLKRHRDVAPRLVFEISEHGVLQNEAAAARFARALAPSAAGFAIDHFGVNRDSLALLRRLTPAYIKLAGVHTAVLLTDMGTRFFVESVVRAARQLDIPAIAQNVEHESALGVLEGLGFAGYQGNLLGKPAAWPQS